MNKGRKPTWYKHPCLPNPPSSHAMKPMPTTSRPDRVQPDQRSDYDQMKAGATFGKMQVTNGRKPSE